MLTNTIDIENIKSPPKGKEEARGGGGHRTASLHLLGKAGRLLCCEEAPFPQIKMSPYWIHHPVWFLSVVGRMPSALDIL